MGFVPTEMPFPQGSEEGISRSSLEAHSICNSVTQRPHGIRGQMIFQTKETLIRPDWNVVARIVGVGLGAIAMLVLLTKVI
jgi:hypothetical protein